ncbi:Uncharacterised protein [Mycobacteroides abscessus subsp. abscessus]|nr:Uncharacterised protein [Mycobacteroides abscessus subsp. abscessus]SID75425.1 Uncharacterised protein [Mycobacteroides abscessus subsp. abscessus]
MSVAAFDSARPPRHVAALRTQQPNRRDQPLDIAAMTVHDDDAPAPLNSRSGVLHQEPAEHLGTDRDGPSEGLMLPTRPVRDGRGEGRAAITAIGSQLRSSTGCHGTGDPGVGIQRQVRPVLFR